MLGAMRCFHPSALPRLFGATLACPPIDFRTASIIVPVPKNMYKTQNWFSKRKVRRDGPCSCPCADDRLEYSGSHCFFVSCKKFNLNKAELKNTEYTGITVCFGKIIIHDWNAVVRKGRLHFGAIVKKQTTVRQAFELNDRRGHCSVCLSSFHRWFTAQQTSTII
jgi:hypothetical protein